MDPGGLSTADFAERAGTTVARVEDFVRLGLLEPGGDTFAPRDLLRLRVLIDLTAKGLDAAALAEALRSGQLTLGYLESEGRRHPRSDRTFAQTSELIGVSFDMLENLYVAFGLPRPGPADLVREEDEQTLATLPVLFAAGIDEEAILGLARVWGESARRVAQYLSHYFHTIVEEPFRRRGLGDNQAFEAAIREVGLRFGRSGEDLLGWLFRRHSEVYRTEHLFEHVETALEGTGVHRRPPRGDEAAVFADLSGYTRLTEEAGDEVAVSVSVSLARFVSEVAAKHRGELVKMLGDGVFLHFRDPADGIRASLEIVRNARSFGLPPAHVGVNAGQMIYEEGDYFGRAVNIAARIADHARADQVLVGERAALVIGDAERFTLADAGTHELKGIQEPVRVFEARAEDEPAPDTDR